MPVPADCSAAIRIGSRTTAAVRNMARISVCGIPVIFPCAFGESGISNSVCCCGRYAFSDRRRAAGRIEKSERLRNRHFDNIRAYDIGTGMDGQKERNNNIVVHPRGADSSDKFGADIGVGKWRRILDGLFGIIDRTLAIIVGMLQQCVREYNARQADKYQCPVERRKFVWHFTSHTVHPEKAKQVSTCQSIPKSLECK